MRRITIPLLSAVVLLASCNQYEKTPSGLAYKIEKGGSKELLKQGQYIRQGACIFSGRYQPHFQTQFY